MLRKNYAKYLLNFTNSIGVRYFVIVFSKSPFDVKSCFSCFSLNLGIETIRFYSISIGLRCLFVSYFKIIYGELTYMQV